MAVGLLTTIATPAAFGPLQASFNFGLEDGYSALVGANNAGKSAILQLMFRSLIGDPGFGSEHVCLILADRPQRVPDPCCVD